VKQAEAAVERDTAQLANAKVQESRYRELVAKELIAREQYDQLNTNMAAMQATVEADKAAVENARAALQAAQANVDNAKLQLGYTTIRAPIEGRTGNLLVQNGNILKANDDNPIVVINQVHPIYVSFAVPEQHLTEIKKYGPTGRPQGRRTAAAPAGDAGDRRAHVREQHGRPDDRHDPAEGDVRQREQRALAGDSSSTSRS
jgi:multidrug efflux system membrane fusion protein